MFSTLNEMIYKMDFAKLYLLSDSAWQTQIA